MSRLDDAIAHYHALLFADHCDSVREGIAAVGARGARESRPDGHVLPVLRPSFMERETFEGIAHAAELVNRGIAAAAERLLTDAPLRRAVGIPDYLDPLLEIDRVHGQPSMVARLDGIPGSDGALRFIEYNASPGHLHVDSFSAMLEAAPIAAKLAVQFAFRAPRLADHFIAGLRGRYGERPVTIAMTKPITAGGDVVQSLVAEAKGGNCVLVGVDRSDFTYRSGALRAAGAVVDLVVVDWAELFAPTSDYEPIMQALRDGTALAVNGVSRGLLSSYKATFELLSDPAHSAMFERDVATALRAHIPWTRTVRARKTTYRGETVDLLELVERRRDRFVLKPCGGAAGSGIILGWTVDDAAWTKALLRATKQSFVVQERIDLLNPEPYATVRADGSVAVEPFWMDVDPFVWADASVGGALTRLVPTAAGEVMPNLDRSGSFAPLWLLE